MKGLGWLLLLGGGGYLAYRVFQKARAAIALTYSVKAIRYIYSDLGKTKLEIDLSIINPSNESLSFNKFFGQLRYKGSLLVSVIKDGAGAGITIQPANETVITIPVFINHLSTALALKEVIEKIATKGSVEGLVLQGTLYAGAGLAAPINQQLSLNFNNPGQPISGTRQCSAMMGVLN